MNRRKWPTAFPPLNDLADGDAYARALECHLLGYSEYLAALLYGHHGERPANELLPWKLVEDLKIRIDQTIVECVARVKAQNVDLQKTIEAYYPPGTYRRKWPTAFPPLNPTPRDPAKRSTGDTPQAEPRSTQD